MLDNISKELRTLNQTVKDHIDSKLYKFATKTNIVLAFITAFVLILTVLVQSRTATLHKETVDLGKKTVELQKKTEELQKEILSSQKFFNEIETRPYLDIKIEDITFKEGKKKVAFKLTYVFSNIGKVPARNIIISGPLMKYELKHERNFDIINGQSIKLKMLGETGKPLKELGTYFSLTYEGMNQDERKYRTFIGGYIVREDNKGYFDPIVIKIDKEAFIYENAFKVLNEEKKGRDIVWPKLRNALKIH